MKTGWSRRAWELAVGDFMLTGNLDIVKTHFAADTPALYVNDGKGEFRDETLRSGVGIGDPIHQLGCWHSGSG